MKLFECKQHQWHDMVYEKLILSLFVRIFSSGCSTLFDNSFETKSLAKSKHNGTHPIWKIWCPSQKTNRCSMERHKPLPTAVILNSLHFVHSQVQNGKAWNNFTSSSSEKAFYTTLKNLQFHCWQDACLVYLFFFALVILWWENYVLQV